MWKCFIFNTKIQKENQKNQKKNTFFHTHSSMFAAWFLWTMAVASPAAFSKAATAFPKGSTFSKVARCHHCTPLAWPQWILLRLSELGSYTLVPLCLTIWQKTPPIDTEWVSLLTWPTKSSPLKHQWSFGFKNLLFHTKCRKLWCFATIWKLILSFSKVHLFSQS